MSGVNKNQRTGKSQPQKKRKCPEGHTLHTVMVVRGGKRRFEYRCECDRGFIPPERWGR